MDADFLAYTCNSTDMCMYMTQSSFPVVQQANTLCFNANFYLWKWVKLNLLYIARIQYFIYHWVNCKLLTTEKHAFLADQHI